MKNILLSLFTFIAPSVFGAEYLHLRNERATTVVYTISGIPGIQQVTLQPQESISFRFLSNKQKISENGSLSGSGKVFIVEANTSPEIGSIGQDDFDSYPILKRVIDTSKVADVVKISEKK